MLNYFYRNKRDKSGNIGSNILDKIPNWATWMVGKAINLRTAGIKDLRFGYITEEDWKNNHPDSLLSNTKKATSKLPEVNYFIIVYYILHFFQEKYEDEYNILLIICLDEISPLFTPC